MMQDPLWADNLLRCHYPGLICFETNKLNSVTEGPAYELTILLNAVL
jgi:hypothetical protein